ncbi:MAG: hypothetical protein GY853_16385, partial [PVC group bacterium]|nr:hypothetical protein [PVC group bacterium]
EKKDYENAIKEANSFIKQSRDDEFKASLLFRIGRIYEIQGKLKDAEDTYKKITEEYSETAMNSKATSQLSSLSVSTESPASALPPSVSHDQHNH